MPLLRFLASTFILPLLLLSFSSQALSANRFAKDEEIPQSIMGISTYLGSISNDLEEQAFYGGASLYLYFFNWALEARNFSSDSFERDNIVQPYMGFGLGRFLQVQRGFDFTDTTRIRIVSEIAFDEFIETRNHWTIQGFIEQIDTSSENKRRYGLALGYTF